MSRFIDADALQKEYMHEHDGKRLMLIDVAPTIEPQQRWIPCSERLPEESEEVLTYSLNGYIEINSIETYDGTTVWENQHGDWTDFDEVVAWMPLPEPYKDVQ